MDEQHRQPVNLPEERPVPPVRPVWTPPPMPPKPVYGAGKPELIFCGLLTILFGYIEKKFDYYRG